MPRRKKHQEPTKINLSVDMLVKRIAFGRATELGKSIAEYVSDLIRRDNKSKSRNSRSPVSKKSAAVELKKAA